MAMAWGIFEQSELFPKANKAEVQRTKFLLSKYKIMTLLMADYEKNTKELQQIGIDGEVARRIDQDELHADKTANAVILMEKQRWVYEQYQLRTKMIMRAYDCILIPDVKKAIRYRYLDGFTLKETCLFFGYDEKSSTVRGWVDAGLVTIANNLKLLGFFEFDNEQY
ncbi:hypothetical protein NYE59_23205 [Paenibacillus sp. FSL L8-0323]|uniref:hypothetical protein n=1 Tax=Paenibacillus sp. FSL L8-0323 TaxID=2975330 RepID=UPI0030F6B8A1